MAIRTLIAALLLFIAQPAIAQKIIPGAELVKEYLPLLKGKRVALLINQTSRIGNTLLADTLPKLGVRVVKIFAPEHGFRGQADAGAHIANGRDARSGLPIVSLYGKNKKPNAQQLEDVDVVIYDIQDAGARFYTYISTLEYMMEACAENNKRLLILDRPNPIGHYVDGPVLDTQFRSFVGMQPVPIVYGMTPGEYAKMLTGERWIKNSERLRMDIIKVKGWDHKSRYELPVAPSPNLKTMDAIYLYPTLCLFEGTPISMGRGTDKPFQQWGHPSLEGKFSESFRPASTVGATKPPLEGQTCYGRIASKEDVGAAATGIQLGWIEEMYRSYTDKGPFFTDFFTKLVGNSKVAQQFKAGKSAAEIKASWQPELKAFKTIRKKYLLYPDFE